MSLPDVIYRVQHDDGRGPWRPGFSVQWIDEDADCGHLSETLMDLMPVPLLRALPDGWHYGCGCRSVSELGRWFTQVERVRLERLGFYPVRMHVDRVLAESEKQVFFARRRPLNDGASRISWKKVA